MSTSEIHVSGRTVHLRLRLSVREVTGARLALDPTSRQFLEAALGSISIRGDGAPCVLASEGTSPEPPDGIALSGAWTCPSPVERLEVSLGFLRSTSRGHTHLATVELGGQRHERVARADAPTFEVEGPPSSLAQARKFLALGVEHIFTGYDHIAFLLGLLLLGGTLRGLVKVVTSFTVAHSISLALAALDLVVPPARLVEPLIAGSIVFVAAENLWALRRSAGPSAEAVAIERRWRITFAFGLVHGFGFASVLRDLHLPRSALATSLVTFNLGVELGQLAIVALAFPVLAFLRRRESFARGGVRAASAAIGALGCFWLVQRVGWPG